MGENDQQYGKQRLRPWLEALLNSGNIDGLCWLDIGKKKFKVPWFHHGRPNWSPEKGQIFKEWAMHTGRFRDGVDEEEWVQWKTRLRCALNKAQDIREIKEESKEKPEEANPYRVFEFQARKATTNKKQPTAAANAGMQSSIGVCHLARLHEAAKETAPLPTVLHEYEEDVASTLPPDLAGVQCVNLDVDQLIGGVSSMSVSFDNLDQYLRPMSAAEDPEVFVSLFYCNKEVYSKTVTNKNGFRLHYGENMAYEKHPPELLARMYADEGERPDSIWLPPCKDLMLNKRMEGQVQHVLETGMEGGIYLRVHNGNILASRFCKCSIFYASNVGTGGNPVKLPRDKEVTAMGDVETVVFDYARSFRAAFEHWTKSHGTQPDPSVYMMIGSEKKISDLNENVPIYAVVTSGKAKKELNSFMDALVSTNDVGANQFENMSCESIQFSDFESHPEHSNSTVDQDTMRELMQRLNPNYVENASAAVTCASLPQFVEDENSAIQFGEFDQGDASCNVTPVYVYDGDASCQATSEYFYSDTSCQATPTHDYSDASCQEWQPSSVDEAGEVVDLNALLERVLEENVETDDDNALMNSSELSEFLNFYDNVAS